MAIDDDAALGAGDQQVAPPIVQRAGRRRCGAQQGGGGGVEHHGAAGGDVLGQRHGELRRRAQPHGGAERAQIGIDQELAGAIQGRNVGRHQAQGGLGAGELVRQPDIVLIAEGDAVVGRGLAHQGVIGTGDAELVRGVVQAFAGDAGAAQEGFDDGDRIVGGAIVSPEQAPAPLKTASTTVTSGPLRP